MSSPMTTVRSVLRRAAELRTLPRLAVAEAPLARLAKALPDACWLYDTQARRFNYVNPAFTRRWGATAQELCASPERWLCKVHGDDRAAVRAAVQGLSRGESYTIEYRATDSVGAELWIEEDARFVETPSGATPQMVGISRDITRHRRAERALHDASQRKDEFLAILMHEMRTPLQSIRTASMLLPQPDASAARIIERQVKHLARLVDDLGESTRVSQRKVHLQIETVNLRSVVLEAIDAQRSGFDAQRLTVRLNAPEAPVWVRADPARLVQVCDNLLHNAAKFSAAGSSVEVSIARPPGSREVTISVCDHGAGIACEALDSVFDLFAQGAAAPARLRHGLGIGLSVVRGLVELHGGRVAVHSDGPGTGSRFDVTLNAVAAPGAARMNAS